MSNRIDKVRQRRQVAAANAAKRALRSTEEQLALIATRRGESKREIRRLTGS